MFSLGSIAGFSITSILFAMSFGLKFITRNYGLKGDFNTKKRDNLKMIKRQRRGFGTGNAKKIKIFAKKKKLKKK